MSEGGPHSEGLPAAGPLQPGDPAEAEAGRQVGGQQVVPVLRRGPQLGGGGPDPGRRPLGR